MAKKVILYSLLATFVSFFLFGGSAFSQDRLNAVSFYIPIMVESPTEGAFVEIARTAAKQANIDLKIEVYPPKRMGQSFNNGEFEMLFPALDVNFPDLEKVVRSKALIDIKKDFAFVKKGNPVIKTLDGLKGKKVGLTQGYPYVKALTDPKGFTVEWANNEANNMAKVAKGRIDVAMGDRRSAQNEIIKLGLQDEVIHDENSPLVEQEVYFAFQNNDKCRMIEKRFSDAVLAMQKDGTFQNIMEKHMKAATIKDYEDKDKREKGRSDKIQK